MTNIDKVILIYPVRIATTSKEEGWSIIGRDTHLLGADRISFLDLYGGSMYAHLQSLLTLFYMNVIIRDHADKAMIISDVKNLRRHNCSVSCKGKKSYAQVHVDSATCAMSMQNVLSNI